MTYKTYYGTFHIKKIDTYDYDEELKRNDWSHLEEDVEEEQTYLNLLFHDKHDYTHLLNT